MSFFTELKRRNVFKVGIAYAIVSWLLLQVASILFPTFHAPEWVMQVFTVIIILGFPLAVFLAWAYELTPEGIKTTTPQGPAQYHTRTTGQRLNYFIVGVLVLVVAFIVVDNYVLKNTGTSAVSVTTGQSDVTKHVTRTSPATVPTVPVRTQEPVRRSYLPLGLTRPLPNQLNAMVALSQDGRQLVYLVNGSEGLQLQYRSLSHLTTRSLPVPAGLGLDVFFSPDGEWVGVTGGSVIYKVSLQGGASQLLAKGLTAPFGGHWTADGMIYFCALKGNTLKIYRVRDTGGTPEPIAVNGGKAGDSYSWPYLLPDGTHLLVTQAPIQQARNGRIVLADLNSGKIRVLIQNGYRARYVPTGHIVFMRAGSLWAVPFNVEQLKTTGPEVPVVQAVQYGGIWGPAAYAVSNEGLLVYLPGSDVQAGGPGVPRQLVWVDRGGKETPLPAKAQDYAYPHLSPDGTQVAVTVGIPNISTDIWTYNLARNTLSRRTFSGDATDSLWTPDGTRLVYGFSPTPQGLAWVRADGTGHPEKLIDAPRLMYPTAFTPNGSQLIYSEPATGTTKIYAMSTTGEHTEKPLLATEFNEDLATLSPDGHWMAYVSNETGQTEIYVRPYPDLNNGKWQVSTDGGFEPLWRGDGKELFYLNRKGANPVTILAVPVETKQGFQAGTPVALFRGNYITNSPSYDVTRDGQHFLFIKTVEETGENKAVESRETKLVMVDNWFKELKRLAPPAQ